MFNRHEILYNEKTDTLEILKIVKNGGNLVCTEQGKYGITVKKDITDNPRVITIPEASVLLGVNPIDLLKFASTFN